MGGAIHSPKLHNWSFTIKLLNATSRTLVTDCFLAERYLCIHKIFCRLSAHNRLRNNSNTFVIVKCSERSKSRRTIKLNLDGNYTRMNKSWRQHPTRHQLYGHLPPITKTIQVRRCRHAGHCWRSRDELVRDVLLWTPTYGQAKAGRPARTYLQQLCEDTGCSPENLLEAMNNREKWRERVKDICASGTTWWWWWVLWHINHCMLFNAKSILIHINSSISNNSV